MGLLQRVRSEERRESDPASGLLQKVRQTGAAAGQPLEAQKKKANTSPIRKPISAR